VSGGDDVGQGQGAAPISGGSEGYRSEAYSFDSTALERAAKAAKVTYELKNKQPSKLGKLGGRVWSGRF
jgi:hypothetical protein